MYHGKNQEFLSYNKGMYPPRTSSIASGATDDTGISSVSPNSAFDSLNPNQDTAFHPPVRRFIPRNGDEPPPIPPKHHHPSTVNHHGHVNYSAESSLQNFYPRNPSIKSDTSRLNFSRSFSCEKYSSSDPLSLENGREWGFNSNEASQISSSSFLPSISNSDSSGINPDVPPGSQSYELHSAIRNFNAYPSRDLSKTIESNRTSEKSTNSNVFSIVSRKFEKIVRRINPKARSKSSASSHENNRSNGLEFVPNQNSEGNNLFSTSPPQQPIRKDQFYPKDFDPRSMPFGSVRYRDPQFNVLLEQNNQNQHRASFTNHYPAIRNRTLTSQINSPNISRINNNPTGIRPLAFRRTSHQELKNISDLHSPGSYSDQLLIKGSDRYQSSFMNPTSPNRPLPATPSGSAGGTIPKGSIQRPPFQTINVNSSRGSSSQISAPDALMTESPDMRVPPTSNWFSRQLINQNASITTPNQSCHHSNALSNLGNNVINHTHVHYYIIHHHHHHITGSLPSTQFGSDENNPTSSNSSIPINDFLTTTSGPFVMGTHLPPSHDSISRTSQVINATGQPHSLSAELGAREMLQNGFETTGMGLNRAKQSLLLSPMLHFGNAPVLFNGIQIPIATNQTTAATTSYSAEAVLVARTSSDHQSSNTGSSVLLDDVGHAKTLCINPELRQTANRQASVAHTYSFYEQRDASLPPNSICSDGATLEGNLLTVSFETNNLGIGSSKPNSSECNDSAKHGITETRSQATSCSNGRSCVSTKCFSQSGDGSPPPPPKQNNSQSSHQTCAVNELTVSWESPPENLQQLRQMGWYWGPLDYRDAEKLLEGRDEGTFLVRDSGGNPHKLSLSFRARRSIYHTRIEQKNGVYNFASQPTSVSGSTIVEFIERAVLYNESGSYHFFIQSPQQGSPAISVALIHPLSRHQVPQKLKHICRFKIRQMVSQSDLKDLNLPAGLTGYLAEPQYFVDSIPDMIQALKGLPALPYTYQCISNRYGSSIFELSGSASMTPVGATITGTMSPSSGDDSRDTPRN